MESSVTKRVFTCSPIGSGNHLHPVRVNKFSSEKKLRSDSMRFVDTGRTEHQKVGKNIFTKKRHELNT